MPIASPPKPRSTFTDLSRWGVYRTARRQGQSREKAAESLARQYHRHTAADIKEFSQALWDREDREGIEDPPEPEAPPEPREDALTAAETTARARVLELEQERRRIAPEALAGDVDAEGKLAAVEEQLRAAERLAEMVPLAREEGARREREEALAWRQRERAEALEEALALGEKRREAARALDKAAANFARAIGRHQQVARDQAEAFRRAGDPRKQSAFPRSPTITGALRGALLDVGVLKMVELETRFGGRKAPLAQFEQSAGLYAGSDSETTSQNGSGEEGA